MISCPMPGHLSDQMGQNKCPGLHSLSHLTLITWPIRLSWLSVRLSLRRKSLDKDMPFPSLWAKQAGERGRCPRGRGSWLFGCSTNSSWAKQSLLCRGASPTLFLPLEGLCLEPPKHARSWGSTVRHDIETKCVVAAKSLHVSEHQFPHLKYSGTCSSVRS